jgi:hypothetical protein
MRFLVLILGLMQLLIRGMAVPHSHAHDGQPQPAHHQNRPHCHILPHSHAVAGKDSKHSHPHSHGHRHSEELPVTTMPADPSLPIPEQDHDSQHDQDAVYIDRETLASPSERIQVAEPTYAEWLSVDVLVESHENLVSLIECRTAGPPDECVRTSIDHLPHLLRV